MAKNRREVQRVRRKKPVFIWLFGILVFCLLGFAAWKGGLFSSGEGKKNELSSKFPGKYETNASAGDGGYSISSTNSYALKAGEDVLKKGGNAVDAAVAMAYTLAVAEPYSSGLGGGGCMLIYDPATDEFCFYDYASEAAASGISETILVPGFVSGMEAVRQDFGTFSYGELIGYAIECCDGIVVDEILAKQISLLSEYLGVDSFFCRNGIFLEEGDLLVQDELKQTLEILAEEGADSFYIGSVSEKLKEAVGFSGDDLSVYETVRSAAVEGNFLSYRVASAAAPFSGVTLIQMLEMAEMLEIPSPEEDNAGFLKGMAQITPAAHGDRLRNVYDLRYAEEPVDQNVFISREYLSDLLKGGENTGEDEEECVETTSFSIIDSKGMVVTCTNTLSDFFGSYVEAGGFYLNNSGHMFGVGVNQYEPGKRPRSHIAPVILMSETETIAAASPGGNRIVKILANVLLDICSFGTEPQEAIEKQRLFFGDEGEIYYEIEYGTPLMASVSGSGYVTIPMNSFLSFGNVTLVGYDTEQGYYTTVDFRRQGAGVALNPE